MIPNFDVREEYVGSGTTNQYTFDFKIWSLTQILIIVTDQYFNPQFEVNGTDIVNLTSVIFDKFNGGGTVTLATNLPNGYNLTLLLANDVPIQYAQYRNKDQFTVREFEDALDNILGALQRADYLAQRSLKIGDNLITEQPFNMQLPINSTDPSVQNNIGKVPVIGGDNKSWTLTPYIASPSSTALETQQLINDGQAVATPITGLTFQGSAVIFTEILYSIYRTSNSQELRETGKITVEYLPNAGTWRIGQYESSTDALGFGTSSLSVQTVGGIGQLYYQSNAIGQLVGKMRWKIINTIGVEQ